MDGMENKDVDFVGMDEKLFVIIYVLGRLYHQTISNRKMEWNL